MSALQRIPEREAPRLPIFDGGWSLLEHFDRGGRRYAIFSYGSDRAVSRRPLSVRQRHIVRLAALGVANKVVAYELDISQAGSSRALASAMELLGIRRRGELVRVLAAVVEAGATFCWTEPEEGLGVLSYDLRRAPSVKLKERAEPSSQGALTSAQRKVARLAVLGRTNAEIARDLGLSLHTVANHMSAILAKTGAGSRFELARTFTFDD